MENSLTRRYNDHVLSASADLGLMGDQPLTMAVEQPEPHLSPDGSVLLAGRASGVDAALDSFATDTGASSRSEPLGPLGFPTRADPWAEVEPPRIAVYGEPPALPVVIPVTDYPPTDAHLPDLIEVLARRVDSLAREQGGRLPLTVVRELVENLVHASFAGVVITILDKGNTIRVSDRGPGIPDKDAALRPGFTSAGPDAKRYIRGVGSGLSVVKEILAGMDGILEIEDNLGKGTVVTVRINRPPETPLAPAAVPAYNLSERQLRTLLLTVELAPVGPTRIARELGVSASTAYRDLVFLEEAGLATSQATGYRSVTEAGLAYLDAVL